MWSYNDGAIPRNAKYENNVNLIIESIIKTNEGIYECQGVTEMKERFHGKVSVIIRSEYKPKLLDNSYLKAASVISTDVNHVKKKETQYLQHLYIQGPILYVECPTAIIFHNKFKNIILVS